MRIISGFRQWWFDCLLLKRNKQLSLRLYLMHGIMEYISVYIYMYIYIYILNVYMNQIMKEAGKAEFSSYSARVCYQVFAQRLPESFA